MATATASKKGSKSLKLKARPEDLEVIDTPEGACPVDLTGTDLGVVHEWIEDTQDHYQDLGQTVSKEGFLAFADQIEDSANRKAVRLAIKQIFASKAGKAEAATTASHNGNGKPPHTKASGKPAKEKEEKESAPEGTPMKFKNKTSIPVEGVVGESGRKRVTVFGHPLRAVARWMGANNWTTDEGMAAFEKMGITADTYAENLREIVGGHVAAGRAGKGLHGEPADLKPAEAKAMKALKK